ncbi:MAG TPA: hypothetical protein VNJ01_14160 [Bacteriovoracaceae bacterium]|nr:hypothetical protein [Bacteriovoracaceae bacterium]
MKTILIILFLTACAHQPSGKKDAGDEFIKGRSFDEIKEAKNAAPLKCTIFNKGSYCLWDEKVHMFKDDIYQSIVPAPVDPDKYKLAMESVKLKDAPDKTVFLKQWNKNADAAEWKRHSPLIKAILIENGFEVTENPESAQQILRVSYGVQEMTGGFYRYVYFNSIESKSYLRAKKENSYWKVKLSSWGTGRTLEGILPIMLVPFNDFLKFPETKTTSPVVDEASYEAMVFNDYFGVK